MKKMVMNFTVNGEVQHTLKDSFFDTRFLGNRKVERMSEIRFDESEQKFFIVLTLYNLKGGYTLMESVLDDRGVAIAKKIYFDTYEAAVEHEIMIINELRLSGMTIRVT